MRAVSAALVLCVLSLPASANISPELRRAAVQILVASYYGPGFNGRRTASGTRFDRNGTTAAHRFLPFGTRLLIRNPASGLSEVVTITDRGPYIPGRDIDLSEGTATRIGLRQRGVGPVVVERVK